MEPAARALGVEHVLVSPVEIVDGICTGRPGGPLLWRAGKATAVRAFADGARHRPARSYAYSNGDEDVPVPAHRRAGPGAQPRAAGWPRPPRPLLLAGRALPPARARRTAATIARTVAGVGGMLGGFAAGVADRAR